MLDSVLDTAAKALKQAVVISNGDKGKENGNNYRL